VVQLPQCWLLACVSTQVVPHCVLPDGQLSEHAPDMQRSPAAHALPHVPQLAGSTLVAVQAPPHCVKGDGQLDD
jgi:hypothetical protein